MIVITHWNDHIALIDELRLTIHRLAAVADEINAKRGITAPTRAVLEFLHRHGPTTVPDIARARGVSRQHIQTQVNDLDAAGMVEAIANPNHLRSRLIALTTRGVDTIESALDHERCTLSPVLESIPNADVVAATTTLRSVRTALATLEELS